MTWAVKLIKKKIRIGKLAGATKLPTGHYIGKTDGLKEIDLIGLDDLVLAVLEEYNKIVDESNRDYIADDVDGVIKDRLSEMAMELVKEAQRVNLK